MCGAKEVRDAVEGAEAALRGQAVTFLLFAAFVVLISGSTSDRTLLRNESVALPLVDATINYRTFAWFVPIVVLALHAQLLFPFGRLVRAANLYERSIGGDSEVAHLFSHPLAWRDGNSGRRRFDPLAWLVAVLLVVVCPLFVLSWIVYVFAKLQSTPATTFGLACVIADVALVLHALPLSDSARRVARPFVAVVLALAVASAPLGLAVSLLDLEWRFLRHLSVEDAVLIGGGAGGERRCGDAHGKPDDPALP